MPGFTIEARVEQLLGVPVARVQPLHGGCIARVQRFDLLDGSCVAVKSDPGPAPRLDLEAKMLARLDEATVLPVPGVLAAQPDLLILRFIPNAGGPSPAGEAELAERLAALHSRSSDAFGYDFDTLIGPLDQPNPRAPSWPEFFALHRLLPMAHAADRTGSLPRGLIPRIRALADQLDDLLRPLPPAPSLIHGDLWSGNMLWQGGRLAAVIDPAIYHADPEIELAFIDLFGGLGPAFWERYQALRGIRPGFWEGRRDIYNLYPLLVHARLFGGGYGVQVARILDSLGF